MIQINHKPVKVWKFPGGEVGVDIGEWKPDVVVGPTLVTVDYEGNDDIFALAQVVDALRAVDPVQYLVLEIPYLPYARQDRYCKVGESFALREFAKILNSFDFDCVISWDVHSEVALNVVNNLYIIRQSDLLCSFDKFDDYDYLIAPDAGAAKKLQGERVITMSKTRTPNGIVYNPYTGPSLAGKKVLVVDDICDGGATFLALEAALDFEAIRAEQLDLYVTHGIFSKGVDQLLRFYDTIYTANLMNKSISNPDLKEIFNG